MAAQPKSWRHLERKLISRAWRDPAFAAELRRNPKGILEREIRADNPQFAFPPGVQISVVEENSKSLYLVIPPKPQVDRGALSDEALEAIAGAARTCRIHPDGMATYC